MKNTRKLFPQAAVLLSLILPFTIQAQTYYWGGGTSSIAGTGTPVGGSGNWTSATIQNWTLNTYATSGNPYIVWPNVAGANAVFGGSAGTVSLVNNLTVGDLSIATSGYIFELPGARTLTTTSFSGAGLSSSIFRPDSAANRTLTFGGTGDFTGSLTDNGIRILSFAKGGTATLTLSGATSSYTGTTSINGGRLTLTSLANGGSNSSIGASTSVASNLLIGSGATSATLNYAGAATSTDRLFTHNTTNTGANQGASITSNGAGAVNFTNTGAMAYGSTVDTARLLTLGGTNAGDNTLAASLGNNGAGALSVQKFEAGKWVLTSANSSFTGAVTVSAGTLAFSVVANGGTNSSLGASSNAASNLVIAGASGVLSYVGSGGSTDRLVTISSSAGTLDASGSGAINWTNTGSLAYGAANSTRIVGFTGTNTGANTFAGTIANNGTGAVTVGKGGAGTWILSGNNSYTGSTTVSAGTLLVNGSHTGGGNYDVTGVLGGNGTITPAAGSTFTVNGGASLAPGASAGAIGNLTFDGVTRTGTVATFASAATFTFDLNATSVTSDRITLANGASGDFVFNDNAINFTIAGSLTNGTTYLLFDGSNNNQFSGLTVNGSNVVTSGLTFTGLGGGFQTDSYLTLIGGDIILNVVPEPSTWGLLSIGLSALVIFRRRSPAFR